MTPDNLRDVLAEALPPGARGYVYALAPTVERLIADARAEGTRWGHEEAESAYVRGRRDGRAEQATADRERVAALVDEVGDWAEALATTPTGTTVSSHGIGRDLKAHLARFRAALDSEGGA
jgi:hypothetical protein